MSSWQVSSRCQACNEPFGFFRRDRHCRKCKRSLCSECSSQKIPIPYLGYERAVRVCKVCYVEVHETLYPNKKVEMVMSPSKASLKVPKASESKVKIDKDKDKDKDKEEKEEEEESPRTPREKEVPEVSEINVELLQAVETGDLDTVERLLPTKLVRKENKEQVFADIECEDQFGRSPLTLASAYGQEDIVGFLLAHEDTPFLEHTDVNGGTPLINAVVNGHLGIVQQLIQHKAMVNCHDELGASPLIYAAAHAHVDIVNFLLTVGANPRHRDGSGLTAIMRANQMHKIGGKSRKPVIDILSKHDQSIEDQHTGVSSIRPSLTLRSFGAYESRRPPVQQES